MSKKSKKDKSESWGLEDDNSKPLKFGALPLDDEPDEAALRDDDELDEIPTKKVSTYVSCASSHPPLKLPGTNLVIHGGRASGPLRKDLDIYVGLESGMYRRPEWEGAINVFYHITDRRAPSDAETFVKLIDWLCNQLHAGKSIHVGCIGGHGRTGTVLSAIVARFGEKNAIQYVRENYCKKAVESKEQVDFLVKHFGATPAEGSKPPLGADFSVGSSGHGSSWLRDGSSGVTTGRISSSSSSFRDAKYERDRWSNERFGDRDRMLDRTTKLSGERPALVVSCSKSNKCLWPS